MPEVYLFIPGIHYAGDDITFYSHETTSDYDIPHSIVSVGAMTSSLDIAEPIVDSSSFTVELAADAPVDVGGGYHCVADLFSRDPEVYGECTLSQPAASSSLSFTASSNPGSDILLNFGPSCYYVPSMTYSSGVASTSGAIPWSGAVETVRSYDATINRGTKVSKYPSIWKGRMAYLYLRAPISGTWTLYRACYLTDNPVFTLLTVQLSMAPVDARIRDGVGAPAESPVARFHSQTRAYSGMVRSQVAFGVGYLQKSGPLSVNGSNHRFSLSAGTAASSAFGQATAPTTGATPGSTPLCEGIPAATPTQMPIDVGYSFGKYRVRIDGKSGGDIVFGSMYGLNDDVPTLSVDTCIRFYSATPSGTQRTAAIATRSSTRVASPTSLTDCEPVVGLTRAAYNRPIESMNAAMVSPSVTSAPSTVYYAFVWEETQGEERETVGRRANEGGAGWTNFAWFLRWQIGCGLNCFTLADYSDSWESFFRGTDTYSVRLMNPETEFSISGRWLQDVSEPGSFVRCGLIPVDGTQLLVACASLWWSRGEESFCLDTLLAGDGDEVSVDVTWTEDEAGDTTFSRTIKTTCHYTSLTGCYRYDIVEQPSCAGIGDWFGHRATFAPTKAFGGTNDGQMIWSYLTGGSLSSLYIPQNVVDYSSFVSLPSTFGCVREYLFKTPKDLTDNLASLLLLSGTGISFKSNGYQVQRVYLGRAMKDETPLAVSDDTILQIPRAERDDHVVSSYEINLPRDLQVTYVDALARSLYSDSSSINLDLSDSRSPRMSDEELVQGAKSALANMVNLLANERTKWSFSVPFEDGWLLTPGALVNLTCSLTVGAATSPPPSHQLCRVVEVVQDILGDRTEVVVAATAGGGARYQKGCTVKSWNTSTYVYTVDDASWISAGQTIYYSGGSAVVSSATATSFTLSSMIYATAWWRSADSSRFLVASDALA